MAFGRGFLENIADVNEAERIKDEKYQDLVTALEFRGKEKQQDFEFDQKKLEQEREKRKNGLMGLGFTSPYLDQYGQFALESDENAQLWLQMNQEYYGTPFWHTTPINYHRDESLVGKTVQEIQLGMANNNDNFDNKQVVNNTKKEIIKVYNFLDIPYYDKHYYSNLKQININNISYDDSVVGDNMHNIKPLIKKEYNPYIEKIPQRIIKKYEHIKF